VESKESYESDDSSPASVRDAPLHPCRYRDVSSEHVWKMAPSEGCSVLVEQQLWTLEALITERSAAQDEMQILSDMQDREEGCMPTMDAQIVA
jgi:hypothetical protein